MDGANIIAAGALLAIFGGTLVMVALEHVIGRVRIRRDYREVNRWRRRS